MTYRFGIVGLSWITTDPAGPPSHPVLGSAVPFSHLSALERIPEATVVCGCDIDPAARERFLERWSAVWPGITAYDDYREMLAAGPLDVVCVATPDHLHAEVAIAATEAGARAIFCEKPVSTHLEDADRLIAATEAAGIPVTVNHTRRWMPTHVAIREVVRSGAIGELVQINVHQGGERAMLWRIHSHMLDLINYYADSDPIWVIGELERGHEAYGTRYAGDGGRNAALEPGANAYIAYANGVRAFLSGRKQATGMLSLELIGSAGRIIGNDQLATMHQPSEHGVTITPIVPSWTASGMEAAFRDLLVAMETGRAPQCPPREARKAVAIIEGVLASQAAGNAKITIA